MSKQDRVAPRTAADIERKYNFGQTFAEFAGLVSDAEKAAMEAEAAAKAASDAVKNLNNELDQDEIFNRLTNNGQSQGIYREGDNIYVNASYIKGGKIVVEGETYLRPTFEDCLKMLQSVYFPDSSPQKPFYDVDGNGVIDKDDAILAVRVARGEADVSTLVSLQKSPVTITIDPANPEETIKMVGVNMWGSEIVSVFGINKTRLSPVSGDLSVSGNLFVCDTANFTKLSLTEFGQSTNTKTLSWKDNGDGTYTLIGS